MKKLTKPPYTTPRHGRWYWEPTGRMALIWPRCPLGADRHLAFTKGWDLYRSGIAELEAGKGPMTGTVAWGIVQWQASDDYRLKSDGTEKKPNSIRAQDMGLKVIQGRIGKRQIKAILRRHAKRWYRELRDKRGDSMAASVMRTARALFQFFEDEGHRDDNPFRRLKLHVPRSTYVPWTPERVQAFFNAAAGMDRRRVGTFVLSVYESAQNPSDVLRWRWDQIKGGVSHKRGKTGEAAFVPLSDWCLTEIEALSKDAVQIFVNPATGQPYTYDYMAKEVRRIARAAGLPDDLKMRYLRHEAAQEARDGGAGRGDVQSLLAHRSPGTQDYYAEGRNATEAQKARKLWKDE